MIKFILRVILFNIFDPTLKKGIQHQIISLYRNRNFNSTSITEEFQTILKERLGLHLLIVLLFSCFILLPFFIFWIVLKYIVGWDFLDSPLGQSIGGIFSLSLLPFFYKYIDQFIKTKKETKTQDRFKDPHEFESEF